MEDSTVKVITDLVSSLGLPVVLVIFGMVCWWRAQPRILGFLEKVGSAMEVLAVKQTEVAEEVKEMRQDIREIRSAPPQRA